MTYFFNNHADNVAWIKEHCPCYDLTIRSAMIKENSYVLFFVGGVSGSAIIRSLLESISDQRISDDLLFYPEAVSNAETLEEGLLAILQGQTLIIKENRNFGWIVDTRNIPGRSSSEPTVEQSIRGARDGFVEQLMTNIGLIRKRIKDSNMHLMHFQFGLRTHTDIAVFYIGDLVDQKAKDDFFKRINQLDEKTDIHSERHLAELLYGQSFNPYPHVRYTERPDIVTIHLLQGNIAILVDQSPSAILIPATFFETTSQIEEYTQTYSISVFLRFLRFLGLLCSLYLLPIWMVMVLNNHEFFLLPQTPIDNRFLFGFQILIADCLIEWIRLSLIHSPSLLSSLLGMIAVFVLGDTAIAYGAYTQEILIIIAIVNIGNFVTSSYELSMANKMSRILFTCSIMLLGAWGFFISFIFHLCILATSQSAGKPYLYPLIPFNLKELFRIFFSDYSKKNS